MTDLANQDLVLYGLEVVYVPAALTLLVALTAIAIHIGVSGLLTRTDGTRPILIMAGLTALAAFLLIARAVMACSFRRSPAERSPARRRSRWPWVRC